MKRTQIYLREDQHKKLKDIAKKEDKTLAAVIRDSADMRLKYEDAIVVDDSFSEEAEKNHKKRKNGFGTRMLESIDEIGFKGPKDLSQTIDKYVYGL